MALVTSYLAIGSNLGNRIVNIKESLRLLRGINRIQVEEISPLYESFPQGGPKNQLNYFNLAVAIKTTLAPLDLLGELKAIESKLKRRNTVRWGSRTIDLDILFYGDLVFINEKLAIPHLLLHKRVFVLKPLSDIAPKFEHPLYKKSINELLENLKGKDKIIMPLDYFSWRN
ncbi:MAG: 2-amino-4-hydroxy-6-hydroxymethyldihydropteridine diphosphokinase [Candidatus Omnitrophica bacterium]|nr:2-amino-4-hydroxy-6-hydroxymethyldihydropteridine diphosphokinase [Candidatus Omnitrophota bacterium]